MKKIKQIVNIIYKRCIRPVLEFLDRNLGRIAMLMLCLLPLMIIWIYTHDFWLLLYTFSLVLLFNIVRIIDDVRKLNIDRSIPVHRKRFTHKNRQNETITVKKEDWPEAVLYLCMVEDYIKESGLDRWDKN